MIRNTNPATQAALGTGPGPTSFGQSPASFNQFQPAANQFLPTAAPEIPLVSQEVLQSDNFDEQFRAQQTGPGNAGFLSNPNDFRELRPQVNTNDFLFGPLATEWCHSAERT